MNIKALVCIAMTILFSAFYKKGYSDTLQRGEIVNWKLYASNLKYLNDNPDSTYIILSSYYKKFKADKDTTSQVECFRIMADVQKNIGDYNKAYDHVWDALLLAEFIDDLKQQAECHTLLGLLYGIFHNENEALVHNVKALELRKKLLSDNTINKAEIVRNYFSVAASYSRMGSYREANAYIDTCMQIVQENNQTPYYIISERAYIAIRQNKLDYANKLLEEISPHFIGKKIRYEVVIRSFWGDLKMKQGLWDEAEAYYESSLIAMEKHKAHTDFRPDVMQKLANINSKSGNFSKAYFYLQKAKEINDSLFSARSNTGLLEIKNRYREAVRLKNKEIEQQQVLLDERKEQNFRLKVFLIFLLMVVATSVLLVKNKIQRKQFNEEQYRIKLKSNLEKEKHEEIVEVKNKEITSYTLQLINKERVIDDLLQELKKRLDDASFRIIRNRSKDFNKNLWKEFNERFTHVNSSFYETLQAKYPTLSPTDLKYCALIKLNFNGNEMAQLLNMSLPSVHIARHRIRKKFGLQRKDNLTKFLNEI